MKYLRAWNITGKIIYRLCRGCVKHPEVFKPFRPKTIISRRCLSSGPSQVDEPPYIHADETCTADPSDALHRYLQAPIFEHKSFIPSSEVLDESQSYFCTDSGNEIVFLSYAIERGQWPEYGYPEVSMMGESNVGKSSLIKALFFNSPRVKVRVSHKPGKTKTLHFFLCGSNLGLVDFPGYGFRMPDHYKQSVIDYLVHRENLRCTFLLLDKPTLSSDDRDAMLWLNSSGIPFVLVLNKIDSRRSGDLVYDVLHLYNQLRKLSLPTCYSHIFLVSSVTLEGMSYLRSFISVLCGLSPDECSNIHEWQAYDDRQQHRVAWKQRAPKFSRIKQPPQKTKYKSL